jgi:AdoMet-dependent heme synthase
MNPSSIANRVLFKGAMMTGLSFNQPTYISLKMTNRCNSRCAHCNIWKIKYDEPELSTDQWFRALDGLRRWLGEFKIDFTGGEALLRPDMVAILAHAVKLGIHVELLSNGLIIDESLAKAIVDTGIDQVTISLDGLTAPVYDRFRGQEGFHEKTFAAINALNRLRQGGRRTMRILLKTVISNNNLHELVPIAEWVKKQGLEVQYQPIEQNYGEEPDDTWYRLSPLWVKDIGLLEKAIGELRRLKEQGYPIVNSDADFLRYVRYFREPEALMKQIKGHVSKKQGKSCNAGVGNFVISCNGDVRMCWMMKPIGNVAVTDPQRIWKKRKRCWAVPCGYR